MAVAVPVLYVGGGDDTTVPPETVKTFFQDTDAYVDRSCVVLDGLTHDDVCDDANFDQYIAGFFDCYLKAPVAYAPLYCEAIYGGPPNPQYYPMCENAYIPHSYCETIPANMPNASNASNGTR